MGEEFNCHACGRLAREGFMEGSRAARLCYECGEIQLVQETLAQDMKPEDRTAVEEYGRQMAEMATAKGGHPGLHRMPDMPGEKAQARSSAARPLAERGQGGKRLPPDQVRHARSVRLTDDEYRQFRALGVGWLRAAIRDGAAPTTRNG